MRFLRLSLLSASFISISIFSHAALAAAFQLYELGTPVIGSAGVGQAALAADASTAYFNPAGMVLLPGTEFMVGSQMMLPYIYFRKNNGTTIHGDDGGNAGALTPGMNLYYVYNQSPCLKFGVSLTSPYGGALGYDDGWVGRYIVQGVLFYTINLNPSVAFRFNDWLSVGAGVAVEYMNLTQTVALPIPLEPFLATAPLIIDGQANVKVDNFAPGFNLGVMLTPAPETKIGVAFRSQINHHLHGNTTFLTILTTPSTTTEMTMPANVILSLAQSMGCGTLLGEVGWSNWSTMRRTVLTVAGYSATTELNWNNTYRVGVGGQFKPTPDLLLQAGVSYDSSPTTSSRRIPNLPMDRQVRAGAGVIYNMIKGVQVGASYEYMNFGSAAINNVSANGVLSGSYSRNYINVTQVSINVAT